MKMYISRNQTIGYLLIMDNSSYNENDSEILDGTIHKIIVNNTLRKLKIGNNMRFHSSYKIAESDNLEELIEQTNLELL